MDQTQLTQNYRAGKDWDRDSFGQQTTESRLYYTNELARAGITGDALSVLEIGFGNGQFAAWCLDNGHSYSGTEIDPELVDRAKGAGIDAHVASQDLGSIFQPDRFDLICAFDVLEHLTHDENIAMLSDFRMLLKPGGHVLARFPSGDSPFSLAMQNGDITHRSHLGLGAVQQLCLQSGLEPVQVRHPYLPILGLGPKRAARRALVAAARWALRGIIRKVFFDGVPRVVDPNMFVVLRKP